MTVKQQLLKALKAASEMSWDTGYAFLADEYLKLKQEGKVEWGVIAGKDDRVTSIDVGLADGDTLEVEIE